MMFLDPFVKPFLQYKSLWLPSAILQNLQFPGLQAKTMSWISSSPGAGNPIYPPVFPSLRQADDMCIILFSVEKERRKSRINKLQSYKKETTIGFNNITIWLNNSLM